MSSICKDTIRSCFWHPLELFKYMDQNYAFNQYESLSVFVLIYLLSINNWLLLLIFLIPYCQDYDKHWVTFYFFIFGYCNVWQIESIIAQFCLFCLKEKLFSMLARYISHTTNTKIPLLQQKTITCQIFHLPPPNSSCQSHKTLAVVLIVVILDKKSAKASLYLK